MVDPSKYLVLDVETNGLKAAEDDLLSISVFKPDDGRMYDRLLPLEKQTYIKPDAARVNGLKERDLRDQKPLSQEEIDRLIADYEMDKRTILTYGGKGFDRRFLMQYAKDHGLVGLERCEFLDFKTMVHSPGFRLYPASKDNLCRAFGIKGVAGVHTSANDCRLEWELFEKMDGSHLLVNGPKVFKLRDGYIYPASYLDSYSRLREYAGIEKKYVEREEVFSYQLSFDAASAMTKFPNNFTGNAFEHLVRSMLDATEVDSRAELLANKMKLEYVGSYEGDVEVVHTEHREGGAVALAGSVYDSAIGALSGVEGYDALLAALEAAKERGRFYDSIASIEGAWDQLMSAIGSDQPGLSEIVTRLFKHGMLTDSITLVNEAIKPEIGALIGFLKEVLGDGVLYQELVVNEQDGCLAVCDLSSPKAVVEVKTGWHGADASRFANQLYYSSAGRDCYVLHIDWGGSPTPEGSRYSGTRFTVDRVRFVDAPKPKYGKAQYTRFGKKVRIRHAVSDWRHENEHVSNPTRCAKALWLNPADVRSVWEKSVENVADPSALNLSDWERELLESLREWRRDNPGGTRVDAALDKGFQMRRLESWWFLAEPEDAPHGDASIRRTISEFTDRLRSYDLWTDEELQELVGEVLEMCLQAGMSPMDDSWNYEWRYLIYGWDPWHSRGEVVRELLFAKSQCAREIDRGVGVLRVPLEKTRYKTKLYYHELDNEKSSLAYGKAKSEGEPPVVVRVGGRKAAEIAPSSRKLYGAAEKFVGVKPIRVFIERNVLMSFESELVMVFGAEHPV